MKKIVALTLILLLNGCAVYDAYMQTGFDNNEYLLITQIRVDAHLYKSQCGNHLLAPGNAVAIAGKTSLFEKYSELIPRNTNGLASAKSLNEIAQGLATAYEKETQPSPMFCKLKYASLENSAYLIQHVVGNRPR